MGTVEVVGGGEEPDAAGEGGHGGGEDAPACPLMGASLLPVRGEVVGRGKKNILLFRLPPILN